MNTVNSNDSEGDGGAGDQVARRSADDAPDSRPRAAQPASPTETEGSAAPSSSSSPAGSTGDVGSVDPAGSIGPKGSAVGDDTVGNFDTVRPSSSQWLEEVAEWTEGLLVAGRYRILRFVGQGGMGKVYLAEDEMLERNIALKRLPQEILFDPDARDDLRQEANRLLDLAHDNVVRVHTYYDGPTWPFIAMEYLEGPTLKQLLRARRQYSRTFTVPETLALATQVARGLSYAHSKGVIHRDLKPGNLMLAATPGDVLDKEVVVKITDFGISRVVADSTLRQTGKRTGTLPYMSPEQYRGELSTAKSDIYSLSCTLYEFLSGRPPFYTGDIGYQINSMAPKPLAAVPRNVNNAILRGLAKDPKNRYESTDHFLQALEGKIHVSRPPIHRERFYRPIKFAAACLVIALVFAIGAVYQGQKDAKHGLERAMSLRADGQRPSAGPILGDPTGEETDVQFKRFRKDIWTRLKSQIPSLLGRHDAADAGRAGPTISVSFTLLEPTDSPYQRQLYEKLDFECYRVDVDTGMKRIHVVDTGRQKTVTITDLRDGRYGLQPLVPHPNPGESTESTPSPMFPDDPLIFTIDLTPPQIEVKVVQRGLLVNQLEQVADGNAILEGEGPVEWMTFAEAIDVGLDTTEEIASASYRRAVKEGTPPWQIIVDPKRWRLPLAEGRNMFRVTASDRAGNSSREAEIVLRRLQLAVRFFGLDGPARGDLAQVRGQLLVEGSKSPKLRYFINGFEVPAEDQSLVASGGEAGAISSMEFTAKLRLPEPTNNKIEVRYALAGGEDQTFAHPAAVRIDGVSIRPPELEWHNEMTKPTRESRFMLAGRVDPYFQGLTLSITNLNRFNYLVDLVPNAAADGTASFAQEIELSANQEHVFQVNFFYKQSLLSPAPPLINIVSDQRAPTLLEPIEFAGDGDDSLMMTIRPSEELRSLRFRLDRDGQRRSWETIQPDFFALNLYRYIIHPLPRKAMPVHVEMVDLAGNVGVHDQVCTLTRSAMGELNRATSRGGRDLVYAAGQSRSVPRAAATGIQVRSPFLMDLDLDFRPFGTTRTEMGTTEVTERVWAKFLVSRAQPVAELKNPEYPRLLTEEDTALLRDFVLWFQEEAKDGYAYGIPTTAEWKCAFVNASDPHYANIHIDDWFGEQGFDGQRFEPNPTQRYGLRVPVRVRSRPENKTPTGLYDMEGNVQEIVEDGGLRLIGGFNNLEKPDDFRKYCKQSRPYNPGDLYARMTGCRLLRRPRGAE